MIFGVSLGYDIYYYVVGVGCNLFVNIIKKRLDIVGYEGRLLNLLSI